MGLVQKDMEKRPHRILVRSTLDDFSASIQVHPYKYPGETVRP